MIYPHTPGFKARKTAKDAARSMASKAKPLRDRVLAVFKSAGKTGMTPDEVAEALGVSILSVRPRVSELATLGLLEDTFKRRANQGSGRHAIVWRAK